MPSLRPVASLLLLAVAALPAHAWTPLAPIPAPRAARIFNGTPSQYPAVAGLVLALSNGDGALCSATLITSTVLVTAAHCVVDSVGATAGFFPDGVTEVDVPATAYVAKDGYAGTPDNDIALVQLAEPVPGIAPLPIALSSPRPRTRGTIVGYGLDPSGRSGVGEQGTVRLKRCPRALKRAGIQRGDLQHSLCWRPKRHGQDTCNGDSGGPLLVSTAIAGVTSGGYPKCPGKLSWDSDVASYAGWIQQQLAAAP
jgi:secreted trypsin-like serine protease